MRRRSGGEKEDLERPDESVTAYLGCRTGAHRRPRVPRRSCTGPARNGSSLSHPSRAAYTVRMTPPSVRDVTAYAEERRLPPSVTQSSMRRPAAVKGHLHHLSLRSSPPPRTGPQPRFHSHSSWTRSGSGACWDPTGKRRCHLHNGLVWRSTATVLGPSLCPQSSLPGRLVLGFFGAGISSCLDACSSSSPSFRVAGRCRPLGAQVGDGRSSSRSLALRRGS